MKNFCPKCNKENPPEALFCRSCASTLAVGQANVPPQQNQSPFANQPPQWNQQAAGGHPGANYANPSAGPSGRAYASAALTVCALVLCCGVLTSIPGALLGWLEISAIKEGRAHPSGLMFAQIGLWGGIIITILSIISYIFFLPMLLLMGSM